MSDFTNVHAILDQMSVADVLAHPDAPTAEMPSKNLPPMKALLFFARPVTMAPILN